MFPLTTMNSLTRSLGLLVGLSLPALAIGTAYFPQSVASGDPAASSVVLWTRVVDGDTSSDRAVSLKVTTEGSTAIIGTTDELPGINLYAGGALTAKALHDGCVKTRIAGLSPQTTYYYQFSYSDNGNTRYSAIGRTRTAPAADADVPVEFAVFNCADYSGRYYNTLKHLVDQETESLDFIVHLGDYIYETTADPSFQTVDPNRLISFTDTAGAIGFSNFYAAKSLSNYRELYKTYRQDPNLMAAHERFPWIVIWDDHEFSDDNHGATATFFDGKVNETDPDRKRNAEQAWLEFIPCALGLDAGMTGLEINPAALFPNLMIYRALNFGAHLELILTDNRTFRGDHLVPEDAFPGTIALTQTETEAALAGLGTPAFAIPSVVASLDPYFDIDGSNSYFGIPAGDYSATGHPAFIGSPLQGLTFKQALTAIVQQAAAGELTGTPPGSLDPGVIPAQAGAYAFSKVQGDLSATWANTLFSAAGVTAAPFDAAALAGMPRGLSFQLIGKASNFTDTGSRYQVINSAFGLYAFHLFTTQGNTGAFYDVPQQGFIATALGTSQSTWKVVGSSSPFTPIRLDLGTPDAEALLPNKASIGGGPEQPFPFPDLFKQDFLVNADEVAGFPVFRQGMIDLFAANDAVLISGDIHASMLGINLASGTNGSTPGEKVIDFTAPSTSSSKFRRAFSGAIATIEGLLASQIGASFKFNEAQVASLLGAIDQVVVDSSPELGYLNTETHGYLIMRAGGSELVGEFREIDTNNIDVDHQMLTSEGIDAIFTRKSHTVTKDGGGDIEIEAGPVIAALAQATQIKVGDKIVIPNVVTEPGLTYKVTFSESLEPPFLDLPAADLLAVNGSQIDGGEIIGSENPISVVVKIPNAYSTATSLFFRVEVIASP